MWCFYVALQKKKTINNFVNNNQYCFVTKQDFQNLLVIALFKLFIFRQTDIVT